MVKPAVPPSHHSLDAGSEQTVNPVDLRNASLSSTAGVIAHDSKRVPRNAEIRDGLKLAAQELVDSPLLLFSRTTAGESAVEVHLTERLLRLSRREKEWGSPHFCSALRNAAYGLRDSQTRSAGGRDGVYILDRHYTPTNEMQHKIYDRFLDRRDKLLDVICERFSVRPSQLIPVRVVGHHLRLLGVLIMTEGWQKIVLVDIDKTKDR